jgi:hypothetical protein
MPQMHHPRTQLINPHFVGRWIFGAMENSGTVFLVPFVFLFGRLRTIYEHGLEPVMKKRL